MKNLNTIKILKSSILYCLFLCISLSLFPNPLDGTYTIGEANSDFQTITEAITNLELSGIENTVTFNIESGTYNEPIILTDIINSTCSNTITFQSATGNQEDVVIANTSNYAVDLGNAEGIQFKDLTIVSDTSVIYADESNCALFENCHIYSTTYTGNVLTTGKNCQIINNLIENGRSGIKNTYNRSIQIIGNEIITSFPNLSMYGIDDFDGDEITIQNNKIHHYPTGLYLFGTECNAQNNFITASLHGVNARMDFSEGGLLLYHNNILMNGTNESHALKIFVDTHETGASIRSNNFIHIDGGIPVNYDAAGDNGITEPINNNFYSSNFILMDFDYTSDDEVEYGPSYYFTLTQENYQGKALSIDPLYTSETDLHINNPLLFNNGASASTTEYDIDGDLRDETPSFGADHVDAPLPTPDILIEQIICENETEAFSIPNGNWQVIMIDGSPITLQNNDNETIITYTMLDFNYYGANHHYILANYNETTNSIEGTVEINLTIYNCDNYDYTYIICPGESVDIQGDVIFYPDLIACPNTDTIPSINPNYNWNPSILTSCNDCFETTVAPLATTIFTSSYTYQTSDFEVTNCTGPTLAIGPISYEATYLVIVDENCEDETNQPDFGEFTWLNNIFNTQSCCNNQIVTQYTNGAYSYIYIEADNNCEDAFDMLYFEGDLFCSGEYFDCFDLYDLEDFEAITLWACDGTEPPCTCENETYNPVCADDGNMYNNPCEAACANTTIIECNNEPNFEEFTWLNDIVDTQDCCNNQTVTQYTNGAYSYIYIEADSDCEDSFNTLYYNGVAYCSNEYFDCFDLYNLEDFEAITLWECDGTEPPCSCEDETYNPVCADDGNIYENLCEAACANATIIECENEPNFEEFTWLNDIVDTQDCCNNQTVTQYTNGAYSYIYIEADNDCEDSFNTLYYNGVAYCSNEYFDCFDLYDLEDFEAITLWECDGTEPPCSCDDEIYNPVCADDGNVYDNLCEAACANATIIECENEPDFGEFTWLNDIVDTQDCCNNQTVTQYTNGAYSYIYIEADSDCEDTFDMLYYEGDLFCNGEYFDCFDIYDLEDFEAITLWDCTNSGFKTDNSNQFKNNIHLYPNPTTDILNIDIFPTNEEHTYIQITNLTGKIVKSQEVINNNKNSIKISVDDLPKGTYIASFIYSKNVVSKKFTHL